MSNEIPQLEAAISGLEAQRGLLGDALVDAALGPLRGKLAALQAQVQAEPQAQSLKQVSILFLDIVGSTMLSQYLDPEETSAVMDGTLSRCTAIVDKHGGRVLQYAGDNLLAVFGATEAREDDAERAVHCGLALLAEGRLLGLEVERAHGRSGFAVRVGLHTGGVLLGGGVDAEGSIRGVAVNIAARMEQSAPAGALRISHDTYRHVRGVFDVEPQPPIEVKGVEEPIVTYLVQCAKPRAFRVATRGIEGVETRMIGRDAELELLQDAFKTLFVERKLAAVTVVAEAGMGKSRLLYEFQNWAEARPERFKNFQGRANPQTQSQPYGLLRDILAWRLQIADTDSMATARRKIEEGIAPLFEADDGADLAQAHAHLLGHMIGLDFADSLHIQGIKDDPRQIRNRGFHVAAQMLRRVAAQDGRPIVLQLDDLHWADDGSLDFLNYLAQVNRDVPMLVISLTRPTLFERRREWTDAEGIHQRVDLQPLGKGFSRELARELLKKLPDVPVALRELITGGADGNPFYMEELVKMLVDQGAIEIGPERWTLQPDKLLAMHVPQTLTGVLQARLDGLPGAERLALQQASVIGLVFWDQALAALDPRGPESLPSLVQRELALPRQDTDQDGVREYAFKHQILHQVTYDTLLKRTRQELHAKAAQWLAGLSGARASDFLGATAEHYEKAADPANACEFFTRAAAHASDRFAHEAALGYVERALALFDAAPAAAQPELHWRLLDVRERTLDLQGKRAEQRADIEALEALADRLDDDRRRAEVAHRRSHVAFRTADYRSQESTARRAMALAERAGDDELRLRSQQLLANALARLGDVGAAKALARDGLAAARERGLRRVEGLFLNTLSIVAERLGDVVGFLELVQQKLLIDRELGDRRGEALSLSNSGDGWLNVGDLVQARYCSEQALRLIRAIRDRVFEPAALINLSKLALRQGDDALALAHAQAALDIAVAVQARNQEAIARWQLGNAELALGRHAAAWAAFERAHAVALPIGDAKQYEATAGLARVALARGDVAAAMHALQGLLAHLANGGSLQGTEQPRLIQLTCYLVLAAAGDPRAEQMLASAHAALQAVEATISDPVLRHGYLNNLSEHRKIVLAWAALQERALQA